MILAERRNDEILTITLKFNGNSCTFQVDTGAVVSIIPEDTIKILWKSNSADFKIQRLTNSVVVFYEFLRGN